MVRPVVEAAGLELVEAIFSRNRGRPVLRIVVDRDGGLDLDTIGEVSDRISRRLDLQGFEPGLDAALRHGRAVWVQMSL